MSENGSNNHETEMYNCRRHDNSPFPLHTKYTEKVVHDSVDSYQVL